MATDHERTRKPCQLPHRGLHLVGDGVNADVRAEVVGWNSNADPMSVQPARTMAKGRAIERLPIAAMNEDDDRSFVRAGKKIDGMALSWPVANDARRVTLTICGGIPRPARHQRRMFGDPCPVVVLDLVVDISHGLQRPRRPADLCAEPLVLASSRINSRTSFGVNSEKMSAIQVSCSAA